MKIPSLKQTTALAPASPFDSTGNPFEHRVARAISACTRCRSRKSKCDGKLPACSACEKAKVECVGFDAISKKNVSRSYIHELEQEVVALRAQLDGSRNHDTTSVTDHLNHQDSALLEDAQMLTNLATAAASHQAMHHYQQATQQQEYRHHPSSVSSGTLPQFPQPYPLSSAPASLPTGVPAGISLGRGYPVHQSDYSDARMSRPHLGNASQAAFNKGNPYSQDLHHVHRGNSTGANSYGPTHHDDIMNNSTARDMVDSVVSDIAFGGAIAASDLPRPVGHFMGASSGVSLARMVVDAVLRTGTAAGSPLPERRGSVLEPAMSRPIASPMTGSTKPHSCSPGSGKQPDFSTLDSEFHPQRGCDPVGSGTVDTPLPVTSTLDPALSSFMTRTDYPTSHSRLPAPNLQHSTPPTGGLEEVTGSLYTTNQRTALDSPSPNIPHRNPNLVVASPVRPISIPALPPAAAVDRLVQVYVDFVQIMLPILHMPTFEKQLVRVREKSLDVQESDIFFVLMVLALSTMALSRSLDPKAELRMSSEAFYVEASKHLEAVFEDRTYPFSNLPDYAITEHGVLSVESDPYKVVALNFLPLRVLQSEINSRLYAVRAAEPPSQEWFDKMFERLKVWLSNSPEPRGCTSAEGTIQRKNKINWLWLSSHYVFMAGITYLYGLWNMNMLGDSPVTMMDAHLDIQACLGTLEALSALVPSARACRSTFELLSSAILQRLSGENNEITDPVVIKQSGDDCPPMAGLALAGAHAESAMRHSLQSQGLPSPLPKLELPTELHMLDNLFLNPLAPHPKASESTMVKTTYPKMDHLGPEEGPVSATGLHTGIVPTAIPILGSSHTTMADNRQQDLSFTDIGSASSFDFLSFLAADDGGREANAQWLSTESYRQDMPMLG
ncbi:hypothetical protein QFC21_002084 [Naganishia friedmannii]|uniref:Uncharacterized protein n=1 Tax=Naganishia friedmannii TaxID=89922 RepID=A0ACC2VZP2_9TREE|nr:hypothetical protein QFC21_002084 [Naganishia friedmannii]